MQSAAHRLFILLVLLGGMSQASGQRSALKAAAGGTRLTQHHVNEFAAACLTAKRSLSGIHALHQPSETPAQHHRRIQDYFVALDRLAGDLRPLRHPPELGCVEPDNLRRWQRIAATVRRLSDEISNARASWKAASRRSERAALGPPLRRILTTVQAILSDLRDAKP